MGQLDKKVALITGGTTGIGGATARRFQSEGATVIVTGRNSATLAAARDALPGVEVIASDARDTAATAALAETVQARHGRVDVLFVNAGIGHFLPHNAVDEAYFDEHFSLNVRGAYFTLRHFAPVMAEGGAIILMGSVAGAQGGKGQTVYGATKAAVRSFGRTFAAELAPRGIRVNTISAGPIETPIFGKSGMSDDQIEDFKATAGLRIPLRRIGQADEVAAAALFLASAESSFTTAGELFVDGGIIDI